AVTVEQDAAHPENDYATLTSQQPVFQNDLPSASLPEGIRGEHLTVTSGDPEAEGQVAMVLGSYAEDLKVTGTFSLGFGTATPVDQGDGVLAGDADDRRVRARRRDCGDPGWLVGAGAGAALLEAAPSPARRPRQLHRHDLRQRVRAALPQRGPGHEDADLHRV